MEKQELQRKIVATVFSMVGLCLVLVLSVVLLLTTNVFGTLLKWLMVGCCVLLAVAIAAFFRNKLAEIRTLRTCVRDREVPSGSVGQPFSEDDASETFAPLDEGELGEDAFSAMDGGGEFAYDGPDGSEDDPYSEQEQQDAPFSALEEDDFFSSAETEAPPEFAENVFSTSLETASFQSAGASSPAQPNNRAASAPAAAQAPGSFSSSQPSRTAPSAAFSPAPASLPNRAQQPSFAAQTAGLPAGIGAAPLRPDGLGATAPAQPLQRRAAAPVQPTSHQQAAPYPPASRPAPVMNSPSPAAPHSAAAPVLQGSPSLSAGPSRFAAPPYHPSQNSFAPQSPRPFAVPEQRKASASAGASYAASQPSVPQADPRRAAQAAQAAAAAASVIGGTRAVQPDLPAAPSQPAKPAPPVSTAPEAPFAPTGAYTSAGNAYFAQHAPYSSYGQQASPPATEPEAPRVKLNVSPIVWPDASLPPPLSPAERAALAARSAHRDAAGQDPVSTVAAAAPAVYTADTRLAAERAARVSAAEHARQDLEKQARAKAARAAADSAEAAAMRAAEAAERAAERLRAAAGLPPLTTSASAAKPAASLSSTLSVQPERNGTVRAAPAPIPSPVPAPVSPSSSYDAPASFVSGAPSSSEEPQPAAIPQQPVSWLKQP